MAATAKKKATTRAKEAASTDVTTLDSANALVISADDVSDYEGGQVFGKDDVKIPFIKLLQKMSPQVDEDHASFIEGAKVGQIIRSDTNEVLPEPVVIIPCFYQTEYMEWRQNRGGLVANHGTDNSVFLKSPVQELPDGKRKRITPEGNEIIDTSVYYCLLFDILSNSYEQAVLSLQSTQRTVSKEWNSRLRNLSLPNGKGGFIKLKNPKLYTCAWTLSSVKNTKDDDTWYGWNFDPFAVVKNLPGGEELFAEADNFLAAVKSGAVQADHAAASDADEDTPF